MQIRNLTSIDSWRYCLTDVNPADIGTRVMTCKKIKKFEPWFRGPNFLLDSKNCWPEKLTKNERSTVLLSLCLLKPSKRIEKNDSILKPINYYSDFD